MYEIKLVDANGCVLGMGYCDNPNGAEVENLRRQINQSGIRAELSFEQTDNINMDALGRRMAEYQRGVDELHEQMRTPLLTEWDW